LSQDSQIERRIKLIKLLHSFNGTNAELCEELGLREESTLESDKKALRNGLNLLGWKIKLNLKNRKNRYGQTPSLEDSRFHPLFFCLNTTEIYVLLKALEGSDHLVAADRLRNLIYTQLSDAGLEALSEFKPELRDIESPHDEEPLVALEQKDLYSKDALSLYFLKYSVEVELTGGRLLKGRMVPAGKQLVIESRGKPTSPPFSPSEIVMIRRVP
jgi:DNA-binding PadR family transcriptional regulator